MSDEHSLLDEFKLRGHWWLPDRPDSRIPGILYFKPEQSITLELMGSLKDHLGDGSAVTSLPLAPVRRPLIHGTTDRSEPCTLFGTLEEPRASGSFDELQVYSNVLVSNLFIGAHFPSEEALAFRSLYASFTHLDEWLGIDPLGAGFGFFPLPTENEAPFDLRIPYRSRKLFETDVPSLNAVISLYSAVLWKSKPGKSLSLLHRVFFVIKAGAPHDYGWCLGILELCRQFLAFVVGAPIYATEVKTSWADRDIKVYRPPWSHRSERERGHARLPFGVIQTQAANALRAWIENAEKLRPVYEFAVANYYDERMNLQAEFLSLAQAIEIFHRRQFGKNYGFNQRLHDLFNGVPERARCKIEAKPDELIAAVKQTRDYLVHYDEHSKEKVLKGARAYFETNKKLRALLFVVLCKMLGINEEVAVIHAFGPGGTAIW